MESRKRILIIYVDAGAGHKSYSQAIRTGIETLYPGKYRIREMDYIKELGPASVDRWHKNIWNFCLKHPNVGRFIYFCMESFQSLEQAIEVKLVEKLIKNSVNFIREYKPDIIIAPHPHTLNVAVITNRLLGMKIPVIGIDIEPFEGGAVYDHPGADKIIVFSEIAKRKLIKRGVPEEKLPIFDFIINPMFLKKYDSPDVIKNRLGLETGKFTIVMSSGGEGIGNLGKYIRSTIRHNLPVQLAVITGRNARLKQILENIRVPAGSRTTLKIFGFTDEICDFFQVADLLFGKGGACTTIESLFMRKPVMFYRFVSGNERQSVTFVKNNKLGWYVPTSRGYIKQLRQILENPEILEAIQKKYEKYNFKSGTENLSRFIVEQLEARTI